MAENDQDRSTERLAGYAALIERYDLDVIPNWHRSLVTTSGIRRIDSCEGIVEEVYPSKYWPGDTLGNHLEFALKYDGTNLAILASLFQEVSEEDFLQYVTPDQPANTPGDCGIFTSFFPGKCFLSMT